MFLDWDLQFRAKVFCLGFWTWSLLAVVWFRDYAYKVQWT